MVPPIDSDTERQHREGVSERLSSTPLFHDTSSDSFPTDGHQISNRERRPMVLDSDALRQVPGHGGVPPAHLPGGTLDQTSRSAGRATNDDHRSGAAMSLLGQSVERAIPGTPTPTHVSFGASRRANACVRGYGSAGRAGILGCDCHTSAAPVAGWAKGPGWAGVRE